MKKALSIFFAAAISVLGLWWALRGMDAAQLKAAWDGARRLGLLALVPAAAGVEYLLRALRWKRLLSRQFSLPFGRAFPVTAGGFFLNMVLPFRAGEAARLLWTCRETGLPPASVAAVLGLDRLFDMLALSSLMVWVIARWAEFPGAGPSAAFFGAGVAAATLFLWGAARSPGRAAALARAGRLPERFCRWTEEFARGASALADPKTFLSLYALSLSFWLMIAGLFAVLSAVFGLDLSWTEGMALTLAFCVGAAVPSAPGYVGTLEAAGVALLAAAGRPRAEALSFVLLLHLTQILSTAVYGIPSLFALGARGKPRG